MLVTRHQPPSPPTKSPRMDPRIWRHLPEHLLDLVLSFLPLKTFLNLTSTCKRFKKLISSPQFVSRHATSAPKILPSFLILSHPQFHRHVQLFNANLTSWHTLPLSLPRSYCAPLLLSVSRGLLCFSLPHYKYFLVSSLVSRSRVIIKHPVSSSNFDLVTLTCSSIGFKIFLLCSASSSNSAYVYDSILAKWTRFDRMESILTGNQHQEGVSYKGYLYFTTTNPFSVVTFDIETGIWGNPMMVLPNELTFTRLVSDGGDKLYLVGGIGQHGISKGLRIWELCENGVDFDEIESLPDMLCKKFMSICYHNYEHVYCFWHQGLICVCCYNWPEVLYYMVSRMTWHCVPKSTLVPDKWNFGFRWFPLVPELNTFV